MAEQHKPRPGEWHTAEHYEVSVYYLNGGEYGGLNCCETIAAAKG